MLEIPGWVPPSVSAIAHEMHGSLNTGVPQLKAYADAVERLACDCRMRRVWQELRKTNRSGPKRGSYVYPAGVEAVQSHPVSAGAGGCGDTEGLNQKDKVQNQALVILFVELARLRSWNADRPCSQAEDKIGPRAKTAKEASHEIDELRSAVERIRTEAGRLRALRVGYLSPALEEVAAECLAIADLKQRLNSQDVLIVERNRSSVGDDWERGFVISTAHILEHLFGQKMQGLVAVLANVSFGRRDITESQVNGMFRRKG